MARSHPTDRFDSVPNSLLRVGAHRAPTRRRSRWIVFAWAALATGILIAGGVAGLHVINNRIQFNDDSGPRSANPPPSSTPSATGSPSSLPTPAVPSPAAPAVDKSVTITILNSSAKSGLASATVKKIVAAGWNPDAVAATGDTSGVETTTVYYSDSARENVARGLAKTLGGVAVAKSSEYTSYGTQLVAVLGMDFAAR